MLPAVTPTPEVGRATSLVWLQSCWHFADTQIVPLSQLFQKGSKIIEIIAVVGVTHNYVFSMGGRDTSHECVPVSFPLYTNYQRAQTSRNLLRAVGAPVVGDEHFAIDSQVFERC